MGDTPARSTARPPLLVGTSLVAVVAAGMALGTDWRLAVCVGMTLPLLVVVLLGEQTVPPRLTAIRDERRGLFHSERWLAYTWLGLILIPASRIFSKDAKRYDGEAASGDLTIDNLLMLAVSIAALLAIGFALKRGWPATTSALLWAFLGFSGWALASSMWSLLPLYSFGRGVQYVALAGFAALTAARCLREPGLFDRMLDRMLPAHVGLVAALGTWGVLDVGLGVERFFWRGTHPNAVASVLAVAVLFILVNPRRARILAPVPWILPVAFFTYLIIETKARGYAATAVAALVVAVVAFGSKDARAWVVGLGSGMVVAAASTLLWSRQILDFIVRDQTSEEFFSLTGRVDAWKWALDHPVGSELWGVGLAANQGLIRVDWAPHNAHNAWVDLLQTLGVVGVALMATVVLATVVLALRRTFVFGAMVGTYVLLASITSTTIAWPTVNAGLLSLAVAGTAAARNDVRRPDPAPATQASGDDPRSTLLTKSGLPSR